MLKYGLVLASILLSTSQGYPQSTPLKQVAMNNSLQQQRAAAEHETAVNNGANEAHARLEQQQIANAITERQAQLRVDTERLLALAAELKQTVDKTNPNILSLEVIKKAQEIEKLAKSVKDKMRDAY